MADLEAIRQEIMQAAIEVAKSTVTVVAMTELSEVSRRPVTGDKQANTGEAMRAKAGRPSLRQAVFNLEPKTSTQN